MSKFKEAIEEFKKDTDQLVGVWLKYMYSLDMDKRASFEFQLLDEVIIKLYKKYSKDKDVINTAMKGMDI